MKMKKYVKPELFYEKFALTQHIADCAWEMTGFSTKDACHAVPDPEKLEAVGETLFLSAANMCMLTPDSYDEYCYQGGPERVSVFAS